MSSQKGEILGELLPASGSFHPHTLAMATRQSSSGTIPTTAPIPVSGRQSSRDDAVLSFANPTPFPRERSIFREQPRAIAIRLHP